MAVESKLRGARDQEGEVADGFVVYREAGPEGSTVLQNIVAGGTEDFISFEKAPQRAEVSYEVALSPEVKGLRLAGNTLELLDDAGNPRLRVAPPFIIGAKGERAEAMLSVQGCAVDESPLAPWGRPVTAPGASICELHVRWDRDAIRYPALLDPSWSNTASMATARANLGSSMLPNGNVLVMGGNTSGTYYRNAEIYNPTTRTWAATSQMAVARAYHTVSTLLATGAVWVAGGINASGDTATTEYYNPGTGAWVTTAAMSTGRYNHSATVLANGAVLIAGGQHYVGAPFPPALNTAMLYNPLLNVYAALPNMPSAQMAHSALLLGSGNVLIAGAGAINSMQFNPSNNTWSTTTGQMANDRYGAVLVPITGSNPATVLVAGSSALLAQATAETFNTSTQKWSRTGNMSFGRASAVAEALSDGTVVVAGGVLSTGTLPYNNSVEIFQPKWGTWSPGPWMTTKRVGAISELMPNGKVLVAGGSTANATFTATAEELTTTTTAVTSSEYKEPKGVDLDVLAGRDTELWARLYRPTTLGAGSYPLIVFLHGNHNACGKGANPREDNDIDCEYSYSGTCTGTHPIVVPNHEGYAYVAEELAARGYLVLSINANLGFACRDDGPMGDSQLIQARAKLVLKHLVRLSEWNRGIAPTPASIGVSLNGKINFGQIGLMGHSRGGDAVRHAIQAYKVGGSPWPARIVTPVTFRGLFEIAPTDTHHLDALNVPRVVVIPMCDGDVFTLEGLDPFDRMIAVTNEATPSFKGTYTVWGANHSYYNTQWQQSEWTRQGVLAQNACTGNRALFEDSPAMSGVTGSAEQRQTGNHAMLAFFMGNVGTTVAGSNDWFDPRFTAVANPRVDRGYTPSANTTQSKILEDFDRPTDTNTYNVPNNKSNITITHSWIDFHEVKAAHITWGTALNQYFQTNFAAVGSGFNLTNYQYLDFRVARPRTGNTTATTSMNVALVSSNNTLSSAVGITNYIRLDGPVGATANRLQPILMTVRMPLSAFTNATLSSIRGVRFTFPQSAGGVSLANVRATRGSTTSTVAVQSPGGPFVSTGPTSIPATTPVQFAAARAAQATVAPIYGLSLTSLRKASDPAFIEIELASSEGVPVLDSALELKLGSASTKWRTGNLRQLVFRLPRKEWDAITTGAPLSLVVGATTVELGALDKALLQ